MQEEKLDDNPILCTKKVYLKSSDGDVFEVDYAVALMSETIKHLLQSFEFETNSAANNIPLKLSSKILVRVIQYCNKHVKPSHSKDKISDDDLKNWDAHFVEVDQATLFDLILASNYLNMKSLLDLASQKVADMIKGKTPEEIREIFSIKDDFSPKKEEEFLKENQWAFE